MNSLVLNPADVMIGILIGLGGVIALFGRLDRTGEGGCFYRLLLTLVLIVMAVIVLGTVIR